MHEDHQRRGTSRDPPWEAEGGISTQRDTHSPGIPSSLSPRDTQRSLPLLLLQEELEICRPGHPRLVGHHLGSQGWGGGGAGVSMFIFRKRLLCPWSYPNLTDQARSPTGYGDAAFNPSTLDAKAGVLMHV